jgi:hypothetical protein
MVRVALVLAAVAAYVIRIPSSWVERFYSRRIYASFQPVLTDLSNHVPFALFDVLLVLSAVVVLAWAIHAIVRARRGRFLARIAGSVLTLLAAAAAVYLAFLGVWGLNYEREPLSQKLVFDRQAATAERISSLARDAVTELNALHDRAHGEGFPGWEGLIPAMDSAFRSVQDRLASDVRPVAGVPKWSLLSYYFERAGVSGMTDPFFLEVLVDRDLLPFERPFVVAHEWAHLSGYADESEANFVGWLTCVNGSTPAAYSGWLYLYSESVAALPRSERGQLVRMLAPGPRADLIAIAERARRIQPVVQSVSWRVYDRYLKANRIGEGVASYNRALVLLAGAKYEKGWMPVMRSSD